MPLATKNGSLIVKDGQLAENCGCCGGWYCCASTQCLSNPTSLTATITATDWYSQCTLHHSPFSASTEYKSSGLFLGAMLASTVSLAKSPSAPVGYSSQWTYSYVTGLAGCSLAVPMTVRLAGSANALSVYVDIRPLYLFYVSPSETKTQGEINCQLPAYSGGRSSGLIVKRSIYGFTGGVGACPSVDSFLYSKSWSASDPGDAGYTTPDGVLASTFYTDNPTRDADGVVVGGDALGQVKTVDSVTGSPAITLTLQASL
jgi:hypothetical protein